MISFREQVILIIYFLIFGMFLGAMFDILHYFLRRVKVKQIISYIIELIFWICMVIIACLYMLKVSEGYLTIYTFLFFFIGVVIYVYLLREDFKKNINSVVIFIGKIYRKYKKTIYLLIYPKEVFLFIKKAFRKIKKLIVKLFKRIKKLLRKLKGEINDESEKNNSFISDDIITSNSERL